MPVGICNDGDAIRIQAKAQLAGTEVDGIFYYICQFSADQSDADVMDALATQIDSMYGRVDQLMADDMVFSDIHFYNLTQERPLGTLDWPTMTAGAVTGSTPLPFGCAALVTADTGYKKSRPKKFLGGFTEQDVAANTWSETLTIAMANFAADWLNDVLVAVGNTLVPGTWSKIYEAFRPLVSTVIRDKVAYQRGRKV